MEIKWSNSEFVKSFVEIEEINKLDLLEVLCCGKSNVGKSTLINTILNKKKLVKISRKPGKTKTLNFFLIDNQFHFVDAPGFGFAKVSKNMRFTFSRLIKNYIKLSKNNKLVLFLIDSRHKPSLNDKIFLELLLENNCNVLIVATKYDKLNQKQKNEMKKNFKKELGLEESSFLPVSSSHYINIEKLQKTILEIIS